MNYKTCNLLIATSSFNKPFNMKPFLSFSRIALIILCFLCVACKKETGDEYVLIKDVSAKVFKSLKSLDENNQPKDYDWAISTNKDYLDNLANVTIDDNILAPSNLPDDFRIEGLKIKITGKKYIHKNQTLTSPFFRTSFGYVFEITKIEKLN